MAVSQLQQIGQREYMTSAQHTMAFHQQIGLLRQQQQQWEISVCDELLLTIDKALLAQLHLSQQPEQFAAQQWVEFISDQQGQLIAIRPATGGLQCPKA